MQKFFFEWAKLLSAPLSNIFLNALKQGIYTQNYEK